MMNELNEHMDDAVIQSVKSEFQLTTAALSVKTETTNFFHFSSLQRASPKQKNNKCHFEGLAFEG